MSKLITHEEYVKANLRLEELVDIVDDDTPLDDPLAKEFMRLAISSSAMKKYIFLLVCQP